LVLEVLAGREEQLSEILAPFRRYWNSGEINSEVADQGTKIEQIAATFADARQDRMDGLTVEYDEWWFNVRPSNTEPLLRLNVEARDAETGRRMTDRVLEIVRA
jgi:phosphomannomutase